MQKRVSFRKYWMIVLLSIPAAVGWNNMLLVIDLAKYSPAYQEAAQSLYAPRLAEQILYSGILIPIIEELMFRGALFGFVRKRMPFAGAATLSAFLFGIYHGNLVQFVYAGVCGMLLAYLYEKFRYVIAPILAHICMNITVCVLTAMDGFAWILAEMPRVVVITSGCVLLVVYMLVLIQNMDKKPEIDILQNC